MATEADLLRRIAVLKGEVRELEMRRFGARLITDEPTDWEPMRLRYDREWTGNGWWWSYGQNSAYGYPRYRRLTTGFVTLQGWGGAYLGELYEAPKDAHVAWTAPSGFRPDRRYEFHGPTDEGITPSQQWMWVIDPSGDLWCERSDGLLMTHYLFEQYGIGPNIPYWRCLWPATH